MKTRLDAIKLVNEFVKSESLKGHCLAVAVAMEAYAEKFGQDLDKWWICGVVHDFDYEKFPDLMTHGLEGSKILKERGYDEEIVNAVLRHNSNLGFARETQMDKTLFAVDELCGLIVALARVRPGRFEGMSASSVKKVMKKKEFAAAINREEIKQGIIELGVNEDEHFELVIKALSKVRVELGF
jgi:putative nucleotidyltransferase with HDIG domain